MKLIRSAFYYFFFLVGFLSPIPVLSLPCLSRQTPPSCPRLGVVSHWRRFPLKAAAANETWGWRRCRPGGREDGRNSLRQKWLGSITSPSVSLFLTSQHFHSLPPPSLSAFHIGSLASVLTFKSLKFPIIFLDNCSNLLASRGCFVS